MKRGSGCCAVDVYRTAALTSFSNSIKLHNIFIFGMAYSTLYTVFNFERSAVVLVNFSCYIRLAISLDLELQLIFEETTSLKNTGQSFRSISPIRFIVFVQRWGYQLDQGSPYRPHLRTHINYSLA